MTFFRDLAVLLRHAGFRRLFAARLTSQGADGVFQVALASTVLFSPERAPTAGAIAAAFATILLPFTLLGPFVGVFLDRWSRRRTLFVCNAVRAVILVAVAFQVSHDDVGWQFYALVLLAFSVNRFLLAGLSAGLPRVVPRELLVTANAVSPTCGTLAYLLGLGAGGALHGVSGSDPVVLLVGAALYVGSALVCLLLPDIGPDLAHADARIRAAVGNVVRGLVDATRHLPRPARLALTVVGASRLPYGVMIVGLILLFRNGIPPSQAGGGLAGVGVAVGASGAGYGVAALLTPSLTVRLGMRRYLTALSLGAAVLQVVPLALFTVPAIAVSAFGLGIATQGIKICVDSTIQRTVADVFRGRVFALYDVLFNAVFVLATVLAALVLPTDGRSLLVLAGAAGWYLLIAVFVARRWPAGALG